MSDLEQVLAGNEPAQEPETIVETQPETPVEPEVETPQPEQPEAKEEPAHSVPLPVFMEMKNEVKALKQQLSQQNQPEPPQAPDFLDPEGATFMQAQMQSMMANMQAEMSENFARSQHGDEAVNAAFEAAQAAGVVDQFRGAKDAWGSLVKWHKQQQISQEIGGDLQAYADKVRAQVRQEIEAEMAAKQVKEMGAKPAPTMANITGAGGGPKTAFTGPTSLEQALRE